MSNNKLVHRRPNASVEVSKDGEAEEDKKDKESQCLTLMEELLLLGLKDKAGHTSIWNDCLSSGIRGSILVELNMRDRIELEKCSLRRKSLLYRKVKLKDNSPTGDIILDETLKHINDTKPEETVTNWIEYLSGESWNPLKLKYQLKLVRERLAKNLVEKGVLTTKIQDFLIFNVVTHPIYDNNAKSNVFQKIQDALLSKWINNPHRMDKKLLCLILLAQASDVIENVLAPLNDKDYDIATNRLRALSSLDFEAESDRGESTDIHWAVFAAFFK